MLAILIAVNTVWPAASIGLYSYANDKASSQAESADSCKTSDGVGSGENDGAYTDTDNDVSAGTDADEFKGTSEGSADKADGANTTLEADPKDDLSITREDTATTYKSTAKPKSFPTNTEVEFVNTRKTQSIKLAKELIDPKEDSSFTHDSTFTLRARELWDETSTDDEGNETTVSREHYAMLGDHTIKGTNGQIMCLGADGESYTAAQIAARSADAMEIQVPMGADIELIERFGGTTTVGEATIKDTDYDTTASDTAGIVQDYRPAEKAFAISNILQDTTFTFHNVRKPQIVTVGKELVNGDMNEQFTFTAKLERDGSVIQNYHVYTDTEHTSPSGEFLPNQTRLAWVAEEDNRYKELFGEIVEKAAAEFRSRSDYTGLERLGRQAVARCPLSEKEIITLEGLSGNGRFIEAHNYYYETADYYQKELGVNPSFGMMSKLEKIAKDFALPQTFA